MLELSYQFHTHQDDSWNNEIHHNDRRNSIIPTKTSIRSHLNRNNFFQKMKGEDTFFLRSSSLNDTCLYLNFKKALLHRCKVLDSLCSRSCIVPFLLRCWNKCNHKYLSFFIKQIQQNNYDFVPSKFYLP